MDDVYSQHMLRALWDIRKGFMQIEAAFGQFTRNMWLSEKERIRKRMVSEDLSEHELRLLVMEFEALKGLRVE